MSYAPHEKLISPARPTKGLRRLSAGIAVAILIFLALSITFARVQATIVPPQYHSQYFAELDMGTTAWAMLVNLYFFTLMIVALWLAMWLVHQRRLSGLIGPFRAAWIQARRVIGYVLVLHILLFFLPAPDAFDMRLNLELDVWVALLPFALVGLLIQVSAEELVFRGYLQSQLAARFASPMIWMTVPTALFALLHFGNATDTTSAWLMVIWAASFGLVAADLTARSGTLGPAIALHFANNFSALLITAPEGNFDGLALYTVPISVDDSDLLLMWMPVELLVLLCTWLAARLALRC